MESQHAAPIVPDQRHLAFHRRSIKPRVEIADMVQEPIAVRSRLSRLPHANQIRRKTPAERRDKGNDVAPEIGPGGVAVQEHDWIALSDVYEGHLAVEYSKASAGQPVNGGDITSLTELRGHQAISQCERRLAVRSRSGLAAMLWRNT
jgi:hypothetical protein